MKLIFLWVFPYRGNNSGSNQLALTCASLTTQYNLTGDKFCTKNHLKTSLFPSSVQKDKVDYYSMSIMNNILKQVLHNYDL